MHIKVLVVGLETLSSSSQLTRDLKPVRDLWDKPYKLSCGERSKLSCEKLCMQLRMSLNNKARGGDVNVEDMLDKAWGKWYSEKARREMLPKSKRSDYLGSHSSHKRPKVWIGLGHLTGADKDGLDQKLVSAVNGMLDEFPDDHEILGEGFLAGL